MITAFIIPLGRFIFLILIRQTNYYMNDILIRDCDQQEQDALLNDTLSSEHKRLHSL